MAMIIAMTSAIIIAPTKAMRSMVAVTKIGTIQIVMVRIRTIACVVVVVVIVMDVCRCRNATNSSGS